MFMIRDVIVNPPLVLAPIAGYTDSLFRQAIKNFGGCGLVVSELVSTEGMTRHQVKTDSLTRFAEAERPISIQIFGSDSARMAESAKMVEDMGADVLDINVGCPVKKVVKQGGGSNLLRDLPLLRKILKAVRKSIKIPLTVKIRSGWNRDSINAVEVLKLAEDCGAEALAIHGRTRCDFFSARADWTVIAEVKQYARIPVIGNGDIFTPEDAERMFGETGVDGIMIGRGVLSNPWLMRQCWDHLSGRTVTKVTLIERADFMMQFVRQVGLGVPPQVALGRMKKISGYLAKGFPGSAHLRKRVQSARSAHEFFEILHSELQSIL